MISTSAAFDTNIAKRTKRKVYGMITIDFSDPLVDESIILSSSSIAQASFIDQAKDGIEDPTDNWLALDGSCDASGTYKLCPGTGDTYLENIYEMGLWFADVSDGSANFATAQTLTVTFSSRAVDSLKVIGDSIKGEYPVDFTIELYDASSTLLHTETVTGNTLVKWSTSIATVSSVAKEVLSITKWSHAGRCAKILEFFTSIRMVHMGNEVLNMELLEESEVNDASLPIGNISSNQLTFKVLNRDRLYDAGNTASQLYNLVKPNRKVAAYIGTDGASGVEFISLGVFWTQDWDVPDSDIYAGSVALDLLNLMDLQANYTPGLLTSQTLYQIIENACLDFGLQSSQYNIDSALSSITIPYAYIENVSHREVIRLACAATPAYAFMDRNGVLQVRSLSWLAANSTTSVKTIAKSEYSDRSNPAKYENIKNVVQVTTQPLVPDGSSSTVYTDSSIVIPASSSLTITALYSEKPVISASAALVTPPAGVSITGSTYYAWGADIIIQNTNATDQTVQLDITGTVLRVTGSRIVTSSDQASINEFGQLIYRFPDNPLVQNYTQAKVIADALISTFANAYAGLTQTWRGNPALELGDRITTDDSRSATSDFWLIRQQLTFDGSLVAAHDARSAT